MEEFYIGGVPESIEPIILTQLDLDKGYTGCMQLEKALIKLFPSSSNVAVS